MTYDELLYKKYKDLTINLVKHDTSPHGLPAYIEAHLEHNPKQKEVIVLELGNYIYRNFGLSYQMCPEYRGRGKKTTIRWFMSWEDIKPLLPRIQAIFGFKAKFERYLPHEFTSLIIQNPRRGVYAPLKEYI